MFCRKKRFFVSKPHPSLVPVVDKRKSCLARELQFVCGTDAFTCVSDYAVGKPMLGWTHGAYGQRLKVTEPSVTLEECVLATEQDNERMIQRAQSSGDVLLDLAVDEKVSEELQIDTLEGPFTSLGRVPANGTPVVVPWHGIWEMHSGQEG